MSRYPIDKIIQILGEGRLPGSSVASVCRKYGITQATYYRWKKKYGGMGADEARRLKVLEEENMRLKRLLAEKELELQVLRGHLSRILCKCIYSFFCV